MLNTLIIDDELKARAYRFTTLTTSLFLQDLGFSGADAKPGCIVKNANIERLDGSTITLKEVMAGRPTLIVFGSISCPMTLGSIEILSNLHDEFSSVIKIVMLYVREAHPGDHFEQPQSQQTKREHARLLSKYASGKWETFVDTIDGELHRFLAEKPNAAYLLAPDRKILFRSLWAADATVLGNAMKSVAHGLMPTTRQSQSMIKPLEIGLGYFEPVLARSGKRAKRELLLAAPPVAVIAILASKLIVFPLHQRGYVAMMIILCVVLAALIAVAAHQNLLTLGA